MPDSVGGSIHSHQRGRQEPQTVPFDCRLGSVTNGNEPRDWWSRMPQRILRFHNDLRLTSCHSHLSACWHAPGMHATTVPRRRQSS